MDILKSTLSFPDSDMDIDDDLIAEVLTPMKVKPSSPMVQDEDSGLGMEIDMKPLHDNNFSNITPVSRIYENEVSEILLDDDLGSDSFRLLAHARRRLDCDEDQGSYCKRRYIQTRKKRSFSKKSLSFGDAPLPVKQEAEVISAVNRLVETDNLTGDGSRACCLPTISGKHQDLKNITNDTVVDLIQGRYDDVIASYQIIDCRYPYEYEAGHVKGAVNIYKEEGIPDILRSRDNSETANKRHILVFYCEFSSERGPKMCRKLRSADRDLNAEKYPHLNFPEIYVMHNGYKAFYESHKEFCTPQDYKPMLHRDHADDLRHFRSKSKSWTAGERRRKNGASKLLF